MSNADNPVNHINKALEGFYTEFPKNILSSGAGAVRSTEAAHLHRSLKASVIGRFKVNPNKIIDKLSSEFVTAYEAESMEDQSQAYYALTFSERHNIRIRDIVKLTASPIEGLACPLAYGIMTFGSEMEEFFVAILPKISSLTLQDYLAEYGELEHHMVWNMLKTCSSVLDALQKADTYHGVINAQNIYVTEDRQILVGECVSDIYQASQHGFFETIGNLQSHSYGKRGSIQNDLYALGMVLHVMTSKFQYKEMPTQELLQQKIERGTYHFLTQSGIKSEYAQILYMLTRDEEEKRATCQDIITYDEANIVDTDLGYFPQLQSSIIFKDKSIHSKEALAYYLSQNWEEAREFIKTDNLMKWLLRSNQDSVLVDTIIFLKDSTRGKTPMQKLYSREDEMLIKVLASLDPAGPIRLKNLTFFPDALGNLFVFSVNHGAGEITQAIANLLFVDFFSFYADLTSKLLSKNSQSKNGNFNLIATATENFKSSGFGFGLERCLYDLNPMLACQNVLVNGSIVLGALDLLLHLENHTKNLKELICRNNIICFIASRLRTKSHFRLFHSKFYKDFWALPEIHSFGLLALLHKQNEHTKLPNLTKSFNEIVQSLLETTMKNEKVKAGLKAHLNVVAEEGKLHKLLEALTHTEYLKKDFEGYLHALKGAERISREIKSFENRYNMMENAESIGLKFAVNLSYFICGLLLISIMIKGF